MLYFITAGCVLGLSAGLAPGPLLTLVISETLRHGSRSGVKVALAPLITDLPIIALTLLVLSNLSSFHTILGIISLAGGFFILTMAYEGIRTTGIDAGAPAAQPRSLRKGVLVNALSPHPYLFWLSVGAPIMVKASGLNIGALPVFLISFYACLVGSKILVALLIHTSRSFFHGKAYLYTMRFLGLVLAVLACALFRDGLRLLGIIKA